MKNSPSLATVRNNDNKYALNWARNQSSPPSHSETIVHKQINQIIYSTVKEQNINSYHTESAQ